MELSLSRRSTFARFVFWTSIVLACAAQVALVTITIKLDTKNKAPGRWIHRIALASWVSDIVALVSLFGTALLFVRRTTRKTQLVLVAAFVVLALGAACLAIYALAWIWNNPGRFRNQDDSKLIYSLTVAGFAIWVVLLITEIITYSIIIWPRDISAVQLPAQELTERPSPVRSIKRSMSSHLASLTPHPPPSFIRSMSEPTSPVFSTHSSPARSPIRDSFNQVVRPVTSKTRLILRHSFSSKDSPSLYAGRETSLDGMIRDDGFESWDTSAVEDNNDYHLVQRSTRGRLETIPGSRPPSPAKPLDGPFPNEDEQLPESLIQSPLGSPSSETSSLRAFTRPRSRRQSNNDQSHIHPLFRTESPVPPPLASPGTVITASPYAGQVVGTEHQAYPPRRLHTSHSGRAESPSPLSPTQSRPGSVRGVRCQLSSPCEIRPSDSHSSMAAHAAEQEANLPSHFAVH